MAGRIIHGHARRGQHSPEWDVWVNIIARCTRKTDSRYAEYGGRGITVCDEWRGPNGFKRFLADMGRRPSAKHSIDRWPDNNGHYCKANCRWATGSQQHRNKRNNVILTFNGESLCIAAWAERTGIPFGVIRHRYVMLGWEARRTLTTPVMNRGGRHLIACDGKTHSISEWSKRTKIKPSTIRERLRRGWSAAEALGFC